MEEVLIDVVFIEFLSGDQECEGNNSSDIVML